jgi:hypothetical protein
MHSDSQQRADPERADLGREPADSERESDERRAPEDHPDEPGAEGGSESSDADSLPGAPSQSNSPLGDTDQHSDA